MTNLNTAASAVESVRAPKTREGDLFAAHVNAQWRGNFVSDATAAAYLFGLLKSGNMLGHEAAKAHVKKGFETRKVDDIHWSTVMEAFANGGATVISHQQLRDRFSNISTAIMKPETRAEFLAMVSERADPGKVERYLLTLPVVDPREWDGKPVPEREWFVDGLIPHRTVTNLSGAGGSGKTEIVLQLIAAASLQEKWFGKNVAEGPCLYFGAEDEADELHRRLVTIVDRAGAQLSDLGGIRLIPMAGLDAVLAEPNKEKNLAATPLFPKLKQEIEHLQPRLVVIDPSADVFGGDEINRAQVRKFVSMLRGLALDHDCAVLLLSHPSLTGLNTGTGTSGSTAWNNSVRSRLYLDVPKGENGPDPDVRLLKVVKANYGRTGEEIKIRWDDGIYVLDSGMDPVAEHLLNKRVDDVFMELLLLFTAQGQNVGTKSGTSYAPAKMNDHPKAKGISKRSLTAAMQRLLDAKRIRIETIGSKSRERSHLVVVH